jgi:hypothetical protein
MSWVRLDDSFLEHPKFIGIELPSLRVWLRALCYCNRQGTGGFVSDAVLRRLGATARIRAQLGAVPPGYVFGLWESAEGGIRIHDYDKYQPQTSPELRAQRAEAGRRGGQASGRRRSTAAATLPLETTGSATTAGLRAELPSTFHGAPEDLQPTGDAAESSKGPESRRSPKHVASFCSNPVPSRPDPDERESARGSEPSIGRIAAAPEPLLALDTPINDELRAIAQGATGATPLRDAAGAWVKFCGYYAPKALALSEAAGAWQRWCVGEAKREAAERDQERKREAEEKARTNPAASPRAREDRRRFEESMREAEANAVPLPAEARATLERSGFKFLKKATR